MFFKKNITIELDNVPKTGEDMCMEVAKYCAENNLSYEFIKRTEPLIAVIDGCKYVITRQIICRYRFHIWALRCEEME